jgi:hypothetical protein
MENFVAVQRAVDRLVDGLPEEVFTPRLVDTFWPKVVAIMVCQDQKTCNWIAGSVPTLTAWEGSRLKVVGMPMYALQTFRIVAAWFPGLVEDTETLFRPVLRQNRGLETGQWSICERKEEPHEVRLVLSIDQASVTALENMNWKPFSGVGQATFFLLGAKP